MSTTTLAPAEHLAALSRVVADVVAPLAEEIDRTAAFPRQALDALGAAGLLGLASSTEVGGPGQGPRAAAEVVQELARHCGSTAMVVLMHYSATAVIEAHGAERLRRDVAAGRALATLAFSEVGSRSQFWAPMGSATAAGGGDTGGGGTQGGGADAVGSVALDARKSWVTSAGETAVYVWSSRPLGAEGVSTLWLVPSTTSGLEVGRPSTAWACGATNRGR